VAGFSFGWNQNTTPLGITIVQGVPVVTTHNSTYSVSLGQSLPTGTSFGINFSGARQSTTGVTSIFNPQIPTQMEIGFTQPLLNGLGRRVNERFIRVARNEVRFNDSAFRQKLIETVAQVSTLYWGLGVLRGEGGGCSTFSQFWPREIFPTTRRKSPSACWRESKLCIRGGSTPGRPHRGSGPRSRPARAAQDSNLQTGSFGVGCG